MKVEDKCRIEVTGKLDEEDQHTLHLLYVPLIGKEAGELYHLFYSLGASRRPITNHLLLIQMMGVSIERLEQIRMKLEQFLLLKTYLDPRTNEYLYRLFPPKSGSSFLRHEVFGRLYLRKFGKDAYDFAKLFFSKEEQDREGYVELTASFAFDEGLQESADAFIRLRPKQETAAEPALDFDYQRFLEGFQRRFPQRLQTKENLRLIAELSQVHGIDELEMRKLVNQCINPRTGVFNTELLKKKARAKGRAIEMDVKDPYQLAPVQFFKSLQPDIPVSASDSRLIESLLVRYHLPKEVINVLIEFVLKRTGQSFARSYVEKVAASWARQKIDTLEKAKEQAEKEFAYSSETVRNTKKLPQWYEETEDETIADVDDQTIEQLQQQLGAKLE